MSSNLEEWYANHERYNSLRQNFTPHILQWRQTADDITKTLLNSLFILNGGGLLALPTLKGIMSNSHIELTNSIYSGTCFFLGLVFALICALISIFNYRGLAENYTKQMHRSLKESVEKSQAELYFVPSEELKKYNKEVKENGKFLLPLTYYSSWFFGLLSGVSFIIGGILFGAAKNPLYFLIKPFFENIL